MAKQRLPCSIRQRARLGLLFTDQLNGALMGAPLPFSLSVALIWPQLAGMIAALLVLFTIAYVSFQRQEIRA
ncbi:hypothetical protein ACVOMV_23215 [Mesorhizobium atlanticum]